MVSASVAAVTKKKEDDDDDDIPANNTDRDKTSDANINTDDDVIARSRRIGAMVVFLLVIVRLDEQSNL